MAIDLLIFVLHNLKSKRCCCRFLSAKFNVDVDSQYLYLYIYKTTRIKRQNMTSEFLGAVSILHAFQWNANGLNDF